MNTLSNLNEHLYWLESILRTCPICRRNFIPKDIFCKSCWAQKLSEHQNDEIRIIQNKFPCYAVFDWNQKTQNFIEPLIRAAKGGQRKAFIKKIAETMIRYRTQHDFGESKLF